MKIFISCDIEGVGCVVRPEHSTIAGRDYLQSRRLMTAEVNAAVKGAFDAGAAKVLVADSHNVGLNLLPEELDERVELVMGSPRPLSMMEGVDQGFEAAFFIGYHAKPGTRDGVIAHNFHSRFRDVKLNGRPVGEIGLNAALAGLYGVPVALVTGDAATADETRLLLPWAETVAVKRGLGAYAAQCLTPAVCRQKIYQGARTALKRLPDMKPWALEQTLVLEMELTTASSANQLERIPGLERTGPMALKSRPAPLLEVFNIFHIAVDLVSQVPYL